MPSLVFCRRRSLRYPLKTLQPPNSNGRRSGLQINVLRMRNCFLSICICIYVELCSYSILVPVCLVAPLEGSVDILYFVRVTITVVFCFVFVLLAVWYFQFVLIT